mmetsp:Transcript_35615/g.74125  ORF Transcript_35615/g.74125 Transcript_35615/m.74125 type:complete len:124 (+) Transcript_35615:73-444(+)
MRSICLTLVIVLLSAAGLQAFTFSRPSPGQNLVANSSRGRRQNLVALQGISKKRRAELGISDDEDEYDLGVALENNTDPLISKIIAGSLIVTILSLLVVGLIIPLTTDYGEGVCNAALSQGRC